MCCWCRVEVPDVRYCGLGEARRLLEMREFAGDLWINRGPPVGMDVGG